MSDLKPRLVKDKNGKICMQLTLGPLVLTEPLPESLATFSEEQLQLYFNSVVPDMSRALLTMRRKRERKFRKRVKCGTSFTRSLPKSLAETLN